MIIKEICIILFVLVLILFGGCGNNPVGKDRVNASIQYKEYNDYQVIYVKDMGDLSNYYILLFRKGLNENELFNLATAIKKDKSPNKACNVHIYDSESVGDLILKYPLRGDEYVKLADHFVFILCFDGTTMYYPMVDYYYKECGGTKDIK